MKDLILEYFDKAIQMSYPNLTSYPRHIALGGNDPTGGMEQNIYELYLFCEWIKEKKIKTYLEIGLAQGYLLKFMIEEMKLECTGITIDEGLLRFKHENIIIGNSHLVSKKVGNFDLIFVDGDHQEVLSDYLIYVHKCKYMAFHDILGLRDCEPVRELWEDLKEDYEHWEFIDSDKDIASGIGVIKC